MSGTVTTVIIVLVLVAIAVLSVMSYVKKLRSGCCGASDEKVKRVRVADRDKSHYPYSVVLTVDGMVCGNCAARVENALNALEGVWASADVEHGTVMVRMKQSLEEQLLRSTVNQIGGYTVMKVEVG